MANISALARLNAKGGLVAPVSSGLAPVPEKHGEIFSHAGRLWVSGGGAVKPALLPVGPAPITHTHIQALAASTWTINHNFGRPGTPAIMAWDAQNNPVTPIGVTLVSRNQAIVAFGVTIAGSAVLSIPEAQSFTSLKLNGQALAVESGALKVGDATVALQGHGHPFSEITDKPTTLAGYGITDVASAADLAAHVGASNPHPQYMRAVSCRTTASSSRNSTALADVVDATIALLPNTVYRITFYVRFSSAASGTGIRLGLTTPVGATVSAVVSIPVRSDSTSGSLQGTIVVSGDSVIGTGVEIANTAYVAVIQGVVATGATAGLLQLRYASEVSGSTVSVLPHTVGFADIVE